MAPECLIEGLESVMVERPGRVYLDVPFADNDQAKAAGARWDPSAKRW